MVKVVQWYFELVVIILTDAHACTPTCMHGYMHTWLKTAIIAIHGLLDNNRGLRMQEAIIVILLLLQDMLLFLLIAVQNKGTVQNFHAAIQNWLASEYFGYAMEQGS